MLDKFKQIKQLHDIQNELGKERAEVEINGVKVVINGNMQVEEVRLNPELSQTDQEQIIKECVNDAMKKLQGIIASKMSGLPGFGS
ncbi:MAG: YbaB/EbfC family nucleoid-associated protein [Parcubacteria group bacterium]|nr:YbaB/EbfC family nucleoid-associated protein [Parcubacteria group bacterium]